MILEKNDRDLILVRMQCWGTPFVEKTLVVPITVVTFELVSARL